VLDDFSRDILAWKLCTTMSATDVSDTLQVALQGSGLNQVKVLQLGFPINHHDNDNGIIGGTLPLAFASAPLATELQRGSKYRAENVVNGPSVAVGGAPLAVISFISYEIEQL
jgi:hypothetical protein